MTFDLQTLSIFSTIVRLGSFSAAAKAHATTQPSISRRIRQLERLLGSPLFDTSRKSAILTAKGAEFVGYVGELLTLVNAISARMTEAADVSGTVRIGASETIAMTWLSSFVESMRRTHPRVILSVDIDAGGGLLSKFGAGVLDVAITSPPLRESGVKTVNLGCFDYVWMASPALGIPQRTLTARELAAFPLISLTDASTLYQMSVKWFRDNDAVPNWVSHCGSVSMVITLTESALGVSLLPLTLLDEKIKKGRLSVLAVDPPFPTLNFVVAYSAHAASPAVLAVVQQMRLCSTFDFRDGAL